MAGPRGGREVSKVFPLVGNQMRAVDPADTVWLSASAGTGKTQVLSARVLRLLLQEDVSPSQLLCLTFTKAGAAEMAVRVNEVLADWVRMPDTDLFKELGNIGAPCDPASRDRARTLFASVLDCPGGGLRIDTIHAFSQWLLAGFPEEAGLSPGTRPMEDRDRLLLLREVLSRLLIEAEERGDDAFLDALATLAIRMKGSEDVERFLLRCASARSAWFGPGSWEVGDLRPRVLRLLGLDEDASEEKLADLCSDEAFDVESLRACARILGGWKSKTGQDGATGIATWLPRSPSARYETLEDMAGLILNKDGSPKQLANICKQDPDYADYIVRVASSIAAIREQRTLLAVADYLIPALTLGRAFSHAWEEAKTREGLIDFDDQIRRAADLLNRQDVADWIRYKLDRRFDHVLIDEAQDTNAAQWEIIDALTGDFFSGLGQHGDRMRTLFVVGDYKQAIFRFQGTSPENFERAKERVRRYLEGAAGNVVSLRDPREVRELKDLGLGQSFRTARPILEFVDRAIAHIGHDRFGLKDLPEEHVGQDRNGIVTLWQPVGMESSDAEEPDFANDNGDADEGEETWLARPDRQLADRIARQVKSWLRDGFPLEKGGKRRAQAGDVMVLVRKRKELAGLIVARLHAAGVPVAGVDRLRLGAPLAVKDLVAALRFAVQPLDDLNLAALLVSPLVGWSQEQLLEHGYRDDGVRLWRHLRVSRDPGVQAAVSQLLQLLNRADYETPQALLQWLLVGPWAARERLVARLGREANDPIDELVNAAHAYSMTDVPSLVGFLHWFDAGDGELKREAEGAGGLVRVMTVHGSKGLQAPIVILADAADNPARGMGTPLELSDPLGEASGGLIQPPRIPLPPLRKEEKLGRLLDEETRAKAEEMEEHWRLLYVAMTRAEEALFVTGALGSREDAPAEDSWYARLAEVMGDACEYADDIWHKRREFGSLPAMPPETGTIAQICELSLLPPWAERPAAAEPRPPRPLAPSSLGEETAADPPWPPGSGIDAARRGVLIHKLLERLPELAEADREPAALRWLARHAADLDEALRREMAGAATGVLANADWAGLFAPDALAEVPIAALVGDQVVAGTIDRLLVEPERLRLVDFKTARRPPRSLEEVPRAIVRQMAAYAAALEVSFPGRRVEAALLYTAVPMLIELPAELLERHKPGLSTVE
ncbi:double-strand break repair helicase AddA [Novosphingobium sp. TH158]|uniref:double-strand break repair helicase AddA n=1 Tax=Novosphingobium sp. TH158 TaxID=2067455 RepID=UPI000C7D3A7A|nr:double-strand break repair helicase AddA [Novosphingobium sp. TH158]PLK26270.1 double-strand break repair helicase AddA [Novosphingobium sp. TH158]